jgi:hypothetical protein
LGVDGDGEGEYQNLLEAWHDLLAVGVADAHDVPPHVGVASPRLLHRAPARPAPPRRTSRTDWPSRGEFEYLREVLGAERIDSVLPPLHSWMAAADEWVRRGVEHAARRPAPTWLDEVARLRTYTVINVM